MDFEHAQPCCPHLLKVFGTSPSERKVLEKYSQEGINRILCAEAIPVIVGFFFFLKHRFFPWVYHLSPDLHCIKLFRFLISCKSYEK